MIRGIPTRYIYCNYSSSRFKTRSKSISMSICKSRSRYWSKFKSNVGPTSKTKFNYRSCSIYRPRTRYRYKSLSKSRTRFMHVILDLTYFEYTRLTKRG